MESPDRRQFIKAAGVSLLGLGAGTGCNKAQQRPRFPQPPYTYQGTPEYVQQQNRHIIETEVLRSVPGSPDVVTTTTTTLQPLVIVQPQPVVEMEKWMKMDRKQFVEAIAKLYTTTPDFVENLFTCYQDRKGIYPETERFYDVYDVYVRPQSSCPTNDCPTVFVECKGRKFTVEKCKGVLLIQDWR